MSFAPTPVAVSALLAVQAAVVARCEEYLAVPVWDYIPEDQPHPFVTVGEATETADNVHGRFGRRVVHTLHVWTKGRGGFAEALQIASELTELFDHRENDITLVGHRLWSVRLVDARPMRDPDPLIRHVPVSFAFHTEQLPPPP